MEKHQTPLAQQRGGVFLFWEIKNEVRMKRCLILLVIFLVLPLQSYGFQSGNELLSSITNQQFTDRVNVLITALDMAT